MNLDGAVISSTGYFRVGYDKYSDNFLLEIRDTFGNDKYYVITEEQYQRVKKGSLKLEELVKEGCRNSNFFFSTWEKENSDEQNRLMWKYTYIDMLLGKGREEIYRKLGEPDQIVRGINDIEIFVMSSQLEIHITFEGETCREIDIKWHKKGKTDERQKTGKKQKNHASSLAGLSEN